MTNIEVVDYDYVEVTDAADPDSDYSADSTHESHDIIGIKISKSKYSDITCAFDVKPDIDYFLLYHRYSTGDSFSHHTGKIEYVGLYRDQNVADLNAELMNKAASKNRSFATITDDNGTKYDESLTGIDDYFGSFDGASVQRVRLMI